MIDYLRTQYKTGKGIVYQFVRFCVFCDKHDLALSRQIIKLWKVSTFKQKSPEQIIEEATR